MKFPKNATPATQANWIALQGLKLQTAYSMLDDINRGIAMGEERVASLHPSEEEQKVNLIAQLEVLKAAHPIQQKIFNDLHNEIMEAQIETDCKPRTPFKSKEACEEQGNYRRSYNLNNLSKEVHDKQANMEGFIIKHLKAHKLAVDWMLKACTKVCVNGDYNNDDLHFDNAIKTLINSGQIERDRNNNSLLVLVTKDVAPEQTK